jgi:hypothetical protein
MHHRSLRHSILRSLALAAALGALVAPMAAAPAAASQQTADKALPAELGLAAILLSSLRPSARNIFRSKARLREWTVNDLEPSSGRGRRRNRRRELAVCYYRIVTSSPFLCR